jgi:hypothetical protein
MYTVLKADFRFFVLDEKIRMLSNASISPVFGQGMLSFLIMLSHSCHIRQEGVVPSTGAHRKTVTEHTTDFLNKDTVAK